MSKIKLVKMKKVETLRQLQLVSTYIYRDLRQFCNNNGLQVYLHGGTLIGALRHKGYIPWDDDIDVCMSRTDYDKMLQLGGGRISDKCSLIDPETTESFNGYIPVVVYNESVMESGQYREKEDLKIGISIFVYDGVPKNILCRSMYFLRMYILRSKHALCRADFKHVNTTAAKVFGPVFQCFFKSKNTLKYKTKILKLQKKYKYQDSDLISTNADYQSSREVCAKTDYEKAVEFFFEGIRSFTYSHYDSHLRKYYGDYMKLPSVEAQIPKHSFTAYIEDSFVFPEN